MKVTETALPGVLVIEPRVFSDDRGFFLETFAAARYAALGIPAQFAQDNLSRSVRGTLRGLHFQEPDAQGKLVHVTRGTVLDVVVDVRRGSPTFGAWVGTTLSAANHRQLWVPPGFAHGFYAVSEADVAYKVTESYSPEHERAIRWDDPALGIRWPLSGPPLVSPRDAAAPYLRDAELTSETR
jgi:dTDP-4-dehydrorhamnose 3,5-epimerase